MLYSFIGQADYFLLGAAALWGLLCMHLSGRQWVDCDSRNEAAQNAFLDSITARSDTREF